MSGNKTTRLYIVDKFFLATPADAYQLAATYCNTKCTVSLLHRQKQILLADAPSQVRALAPAGMDFKAGSHRCTPCSIGQSWLNQKQQSRLQIPVDSCPREAPQHSKVGKPSLVQHNQHGQTNGNSQALLNPSKHHSKPGSIEHEPVKLVHLCTRGKTMQEFKAMAEICTEVCCCA